MTQAPSFNADKPRIGTHPVNGGDALLFSVTPSPPQWWWRALRLHAGVNPALVRPWDKEQESLIAVVCPTLDGLTAVIDAVNGCVDQANEDYRRELELQHQSAEQLKTDKADRTRYIHDIQAAIDERYDRKEAAVVA
jgi:hypothetical protein